MRLLFDIGQSPNQPPDPATSFRKAVRAIIIETGQLLMIHSTVNLDFKFPGGGIEDNEGHPLALRREVLEETGMHIHEIGALFGYAHELRPSSLPGFSMLSMDSFYYFVTLSPDQQPHPLQLGGYEADLGFHPVWITVTEAIRANRLVLASGSIPPWTGRDTRVLEILAEELGELQPPD